MSCFFCGTSQLEDDRQQLRNDIINQSFSGLVDSRLVVGLDDKTSLSGENNYTHRFTFQELADATKNFKLTNLIGEGGFGKVYKGSLESGQVVAIKQLNRDGLQGSHEFLVECLMLIMLHHPNLVSLIGYCAEGDERILVYEYMPKGSLEQHLFDLPPYRKPLDWNNRVKIALGAANGLTYLHDVVKPPVIYRDLKSANILLDKEFNPKLSDFGLAKLGPDGDNTHVSTRVMGTYGYCAPDYAMSGKLTVKSDVYSFGVVLLELITGRRAFDYSKKLGEQNLIVWSRPFLKDRKRFYQLADPLLQRRFPLRALYQLAVVTAMCLHDQPNARPSMQEVASALEHVASQPFMAEGGHEMKSKSSGQSPQLGYSMKEDHGLGISW